MTGHRLPAADAPIVVLAPGYREQARLCAPGVLPGGQWFHVVRYDNVNRRESDGLVTQFRLEDMEADLETVLDHVANHRRDDSSASWRPGVCGTRRAEGGRQGVACAALTPHQRVWMSGIRRRPSIKRTDWRASVRCTAKAW